MESAPSWISTPLQWCGLTWPEGDGTRLNALGDAWTQHAETAKKRLEAATATAEAVWNQNSGDGVDEFRKWWAAPGGPAQNLTRSVESATSLAAAFYRMAVEVRLLKAAFVTGLGALAAAAVAAGIAIFFSGGLLATAAPPAAAGAGRGIALLIAALAALCLVGLIAKYIDEAELKDADPKSAPTPKPQLKKIGPSPVVVDWDELQRPRCFITPNDLPIRNPLFTGDGWTGPNDPDFLTRGGGIFHINKDNDNKTGIERVLIQCLLQDPLTGTGRFNKKLGPLAGALGLSTEDYQNGHLIGPYSGSEANAALYLSPRVNVNQGEGRASERWLESLHQYAKGKDGYVQLQAFAQSHARQAFQDPYGNGVGYSLLHRTNYEATVCTPDPYERGKYVPTETYRFSYDVTPPKWDAQNQKWGPGSVYNRNVTGPGFIQ